MRTTISGAIDYYQSNAPRGEYVLVVEGCTSPSANIQFWTDMSVLEHVEFYVNQGMKKMDAIKSVAKDRDLPKNEIYKIVNT